MSPPDPKRPLKKAEEPACDLTLAWERGRFRPIDLRHAPYAPAALLRLAAAIRKSEYWRGRRYADRMEPYDMRLISEMVDLAYTGNLAQALELLRLAWPLGAAERLRFQREFLTLLRSGDYWPDISTLAQITPLNEPATDEAGPVCTNER